MSTQHGAFRYDISMFNAIMEKKWVCVCVCVYVCTCGDAMDREGDVGEVGEEKEVLLRAVELQPGAHQRAACPRQRARAEVCGVAVVWGKTAHTNLPFRSLSTTGCSSTDRL